MQLIEKDGIVKQSAPCHSFFYNNPLNRSTKNSNGIMQRVGNSVHTPKVCTIDESVPEWSSKSNANGAPKQRNVAAMI